MIKIGKNVILHQDGVALSTELWGINRFPDGQIQFWLEDSVSGPLDLDIAITDSEMLDLFIQMIYLRGFKSIQINYLYGGRSDKSRAGSRYVSDLNAMLMSIVSRFAEGQVDVVMPHNISTGWSSIVPLHDCFTRENYDLILFPDESAAKRFQNEFHGIVKHTCVKKRDQQSGEIVSHWIPTDVEDFDRILVVDDLCDGGRTFLNIAEKLNQATGGANKLDLYVVHGVFSNNAIARLKESYDTIYTTNSYQDFPGQGLVVKNVWRSAL